MNAGVWRSETMSRRGLRKAVCGGHLKWANFIRRGGKDVPTARWTRYSTT